MKNFIRYLKRRMSSEITVVSGLPRTGTSMMMKMLVAGGIPPIIDNIRRADKENPKGYYEFERVKKLPDGDIDWLKTADGKVVKIISALLPYLPDSYNYRILFMERNVDEVLASQRKMLIRQGKPSDSVDDVEMATLFSSHIKKIDAWLTSHRYHTQCLRVSYNSVITDSQSSLLAINEFLGGDLNCEKMQRVIDTSLYRNRRNG